MSAGLFVILPELAVMAVVTLLTLLEMTFPSLLRRFSTGLNLAGIATVGGALVFISRHPGMAFHGMFTADVFSLFFKCLFLATAACILIMRRESSSLNRGAEFHLILWSALLGMFFLVSAKNFLLFFISLELMTLSLYVLAAYSRADLRSIEAGLKYLVLGSLASAFLLYGISLIYAATGTLSFDELGSFLGREGGARATVPLLFLAGVLLVLSALGFKVASVPFQVWVPDVYQGAPTPVVALFSVASKSAGFAALGRIFLGTLGALDGERRVLFSLLAALTLLYGNLGALVQKDVKRLLGYSSIGHAGFLLIALSATKEWGGASLLYYLIAYAVSNLTAFLVVTLVEQRENSNELVAYRGLSRKAPLLAAGMFLALLSLAGVPPLAGFFAKFFILLAAARSNLSWLVFLGAMNGAISLYYYLNVIRTLYFEKPDTQTPYLLSRSSILLLYALMAGIVAVGVWQAPFLLAATSAAGSLL